MKRQTITETVTNTQIKENCDRGMTLEQSVETNSVDQIVLHN